MPLMRAPTQKPVKLQLRRDLVRSIKRGHAWVYVSALRALPPAEPGAQAILLDNRGGREIARGFYYPESDLALRVCTTQRGERIDDAWAASRLQRALALRASLFGPDTTAYRLVNGEGDGLPGLVIDRYNTAAVLKLDGEAATRFYDAEGIAAWLAGELGLELVYERFSGRKGGGRALFGLLPEQPQPFLEAGLHFTADLVRGQKTGFFLDQRENRGRIQPYAPDARVLNAFGYTGGFSVYAGFAGALHVTTLDTAAPALQAADHHWTLNNLDPAHHDTIQADAFEFLEKAAKDGKDWDLIILDPPSFAPSKKALPQALKAYRKLIAAGAAVTTPGGILAASSCSSHVSMEDFLAACREGLSTSRRTATTLGLHTQPADHPAPLAMPEFRYLKFILMRVEG
ncbi:MAG: class I SAM-dependent rRNA methyltransferase [Anaerolineae bacterium]|nr:class I SAM-dependent rRNA methyltransferase [Anaerolineae bacterium]